MNENIDYNGLIKEIGKCCLSEEYCGTCNKETCLVGYCEQSLLTAFKKKDEFIDNGVENIPYEDTKLYDEDKLFNAIGFILNQCKNCRLYHDEDCIINIIRSALEVALLGDHMEYKGSVLIYFSELSSKNKEMAEKIYSAFNQFNKNLSYRRY